MSALVRYEAAEWIAAARKSFRPSLRTACVVCHKYEGLTQAHHVVPLSMQFAADMELSHEHVWLCPTHHVALHVLIAQAASERERASQGVINVIGSLDHAEIAALMDLTARAFK